MLRRRRLTGLRRSRVEWGDGGGRGGRRPAGSRRGRFDDEGFFVRLRGRHGDPAPGNSLLAKPGVLDKLRPQICAVPHRELRQTWHAGERIDVHVNVSMQKDLLDGRQTIDVQVRSCDPVPTPESQCFQPLVPLENREADGEFR